MKNAQYTVKEMKQFLNNISGMYDMARVVDPIECRIININDDGTVNMNSKCYGIWNAGTKCSNCSSAVACKTGCHQEKSEFFDDKIFTVHSNPVTLKLPDGGSFEAVVELVNIDEKGPDSISGNDRAAENIDHKAARYRLVHDELTRLLNPGPFYEMTRQMIVDNPDNSWIMISADIMNFRLVNTLFGELKGNELLVATAEALNKIVSSGYGLCGRLGGDHFSVLLDQRYYDENSLLSIQKDLSERFNCGIYSYIIHFGVYVINDSSLPISVMCGRANSALKIIKDSLTETVSYFDDRLQHRILFEQEVISGFAKAISQEEFKMFLQPLSDENGKIFGAEALARWIKSDGTMIMPGDFIEILEQANLIHELDVYIWECAIRQLVKWKDGRYKDLFISVNMSAKDFFSMDVYSVLTDLIEKYDIDAAKLRLEITETCLLEEPRESDKIITKLRNRGFLVEIDDFGKGFSSISMLKQIHADVLKVDMSLLQEINSKTRSKIILRSIINMAYELGMDVISEGVETKEEMDELSLMGCKHFQGYYISKPVPVSEFENRF